LQLVDRVTLETLRALRAALPGIKIVPVIHVIGPESVREAREMASVADAILLDSGNPTLAVKELGGTGRTHDWTLSRQIRDAVPVPVYLAGGLGSHNVRQALQAVRPFGLDLCSSVRSAGQLDRARLTAFFDRVAGQD
ncbi:MAG: phosphoribosylanthranilate isomerase, partial [Planctomycetes bacterium]|nr:phosphoribosylanthranilate isomerase [Planctomycetota bacterium]